MDIQNPEVWLSHLLEALSEEKLAAKLSDENPQWEYIDGEIVKLARWPTASLISRKSSVRGWCFWRQKVRIFAC